VRHVLEKRVCSGAVGNLPTREQEGDGPAESIGQGVDLRGATAPRATNRLRPFPPFPPAAHRCALTADESIRT